MFCGLRESDSSRCKVNSDETRIREAIKERQTIWTSC